MRLLALAAKLVYRFALMCNGFSLPEALELEVRYLELELRDLHHAPKYQHTELCTLPFSGQGEQLYAHHAAISIVTSLLTTIVHAYES